MSRLTGRKAVILGAGGEGNMGQVIARRLAKEGASILVSGRKAEPLDALAAELQGSFTLCDIAKKSDVEQLLASAVEKMGGCDIVVNAVGTGIMVPAVETDEAQLETMIDTQFKGPFFLFQIFGAHMAANGGGSIVQISSATTQCIVDSYAAYIGTKAGADGLVRAFANELGGAGVRFNSIAPGFTATPMTAAVTGIPGIEAAFASRAPLGRVGSSDDIADAAVWLAEPSCFMTGQTLHVNGGLTLRGNPTGLDMHYAMTAATGG
jgi:2-hydroxycyclohexanecarboxyl-CoA dehydrogenase